MRLLDLLVDLLDQGGRDLKRKLDKSFVEDRKLFCGEFKVHYGTIFSTFPFFQIDPDVNPVADVGKLFM